MYLKVLIILVVECVAATTLHEDIGDIPYDIQVSGATSPELPSTVSVKDYGEISYEGMTFNSYGDIVYEKGKKPSVGEDYGAIPFESYTSTIKSDTSTINIPEMVKALLGGREVPGMVKTGTPVKTQVTSPTTSPSRSLTNPSSKPKPTVIASTEFGGTIDEIRMRAMEDEEYIGDHTPGTIDDSDCDPQAQSCSTCRDEKGYRVYCLKGTTTQPPRDLAQLVAQLVHLTKDYQDYSNPKKLNKAAFEKYITEKYTLGWPFCETTASTTPTPSPTDAPHQLAGKTIAQCYVCGMLEVGIPDQDNMCSDSFMTRHYKKHCKFLNREGWSIGGSAGFYMWGRWSGGCAMRFVDISPVYTQRTCRNNVVPALGGHYVSRRMAKLEYLLRREKDACITSPTASLVPLSRGISLYSRFTACVCSKPYCNRAERVSPLIPWLTVGIAVIATFTCYFLGSSVDLFYK